MSHQDKGYVGFTNIKKADWERIFGKDRPKDRPDDGIKRGRARKDSDDFTGGGLKGKHRGWV